VLLKTKISFFCLFLANAEHSSSVGQQNDFQSFVFLVAKTWNKTCLADMTVTVLISITTKIPVVSNKHNKKKYIYIFLQRYEKNKKKSNKVFLQSVWLA